MRSTPSIRRPRQRASNPASCSTAFATPPSSFGASDACTWAIHGSVAATVAGEVLAVASVMPEGLPGDPLPGDWRIRGMASTPDVRGRGRPSGGVVHVKLIEEDGWFQVTQKGSHRQFKHPVKLGRVTVAGHPSQEMDNGTLNSIFKQAGLR